jgi:hypothetical protein
MLPVPVPVSVATDDATHTHTTHRCVEFKAMLRAASSPGAGQGQGQGAMADALPVDASCEDIEVDEALPMLRAFVQQALDAGASPYTPPARAVSAAPCPAVCVYVCVCVCAAVLLDPLISPSALCPLCAPCHHAIMPYATGG